jgi:hypothetical protein
MAKAFLPPKHSVNIHLQSRIKPTIPKHQTKQLIVAARAELGAYFDSAPGGKGTTKHKLLDLIGDLDNSQHKANLQVRDQHFVVNVGEMIGYHVHWKSDHKHWH